MLIAWSIKNFSLCGSSIGDCFSVMWLEFQNRKVFTIFILQIISVVEIKLICVGSCISHDDMKSDKRTPR